MSWKDLPWHCTIGAVLSRDVIFLQKYWIVRYQFINRSKANVGGILLIDTTAVVFEKSLFQCHHISNGIHNVYKDVLYTSSNNGRCSWRKSILLYLWNCIQDTVQCSSSTSANTHLWYAYCGEIDNTHNNLQTICYISKLLCL